ncbi:MAG: transposase [Candidatus Eremiobacteraeota bacterium]|nr:transposase [Candidatus Eremiobacteraeota bacterium]MCW5867553.1 transposase [Candidatus Eremiobacteraeota bacterium]
MLLQNYRGCSDRELVERIRFDLRYKVALGVKVDYAGFDPSLLSIFRARLLLHRKESLAFEKTVKAAHQHGLIGDVQPIDSMPIFGAAALQDTYTLIRTGMEKLLAAVKKQRDEWKGSRGFKYPFTAKKYEKGRGKADIDWGDKAQRQLHLNELVEDAASLIEAVEASKMVHSKRVQGPMELLKRILVQDVEQSSEGDTTIKRGGKDRIISTNDPESRHGHKTSCDLIKGYKGNFTVSEHEIVTSVAVTPANAADTAPVESMLEELESRGCRPKQLPADCAYGGADFRALMETKGVEVVAKVPKPPKGERFPKADFLINLGARTVTCPAGETTYNFRESKDPQGRGTKTFRFTGCPSCALRDKCIPSTERTRSIQLHYNEGYLQKAKQRAAEPDFRDEMKRRLVVERVQARLQSYGLSASRYFGIRKPLLQAVFTATANNIWRLIIPNNLRGSP